MKKIWTIALATTLFCTAFASAGSDEKAKKGRFSTKDYEFLCEAARGSITEVTLAELAKQKGSNTAVKNYAERMLADHGKANQELQKIATDKGASLPTDLTGKHQKITQKMLELSGAEFDKAYAKHMTNDHTEDTKKFAEAAKSVKDPDLKAFAEKTLPVLQEHLRMAEEMEKLVGAK